jgi:hypothetical protein
MQIDKIIEKVREIVKNADEAPGSIVLATYTKDEFEELRPGEDYDAFKKRERQVAERLAAEGIAGAVVFQEIDSVGFYRYLAAERLPNNEASRSAYAALKYNAGSGRKEKKMKYITRDREAGNSIDEFATMAEAEAAIERYEAEDMEMGTYEPNFYEVAEIEEA